MLIYELVISFKFMNFFHFNDSIIQIKESDALFELAQAESFFSRYDSEDIGIEIYNQLHPYRINKTFMLFLQRNKILYFLNHLFYK
jgi:hypothetical protein